ncbi:MAG TPA: nucleoside recognition domain-containing protein [Limnochordales bacterium]
MTASPLARGLRKGMETTWILAKAIVPTYLAVDFLAKTPVIEYISRLAAPVLALVGLPGETALPLVLGMVANLYMGIGALAPLELGVREATICAVILTVAHNLPVETAVTRQMGVSVWFALAVRLGLAFGLAFLMHLVWRV